MNNSLERELSLMTDSEFRQLELRMQVSRLIRNLFKEYNITEEQVMAELKIDKATFHNYLRAAHNFSVEEIADISTFGEQVTADAAKTEFSKKIQIPPGRE